MRRIKRFIENLVRIFQYLPLIWRDRDWDEQFLLTLLEFKLRRMSNYFHKYGITVGNEEQAKQCKLAADLCKRMIDSEYWEHGIEWVQTGEEFLDGYFRRKPGFFFWESPMKYEDYMYEQDLYFLCRILKKYMRQWWD